MPYLLGEVFYFFHLYSAPRGRASPALVQWAAALRFMHICSTAGKQLLEETSCLLAAQLGLITRSKIALFSEPGVFFISPQTIQLKDKRAVPMKACPSKAYLYFSFSLQVLASSKIASGWWVRRKGRRALL